MPGSYQSFSEFWPFYVCEHSKLRTRKFHFLGTLSIVPVLILGFAISYCFFLLVPVSAYGFAWYSHFFIEKNKPATFIHPMWSLLGDFRMFALMCTGKMDAEVERCMKFMDDS